MIITRDGRLKVNATITSDSFSALQDPLAISSQRIGTGSRSDLNNHASGGKNNWIINSVGEDAMSLIQHGSWRQNLKISPNHGGHILDHGSHILDHGSYTQVRCGYVLVDVSYMCTGVGA